jgi:hypothetical protein
MFSSTGSSNTSFAAFRLASLTDEPQNRNRQERRRSALSSAVHWFGGPQSVPSAGTEVLVRKDRKVSPRSRTTRPPEICKFPSGHRRRLTTFVPALTLTLALQNQQDADDEQRHANASGGPPDGGIAEGKAKGGNRHKYNRPTEHKVPRASCLTVFLGLWSGRRPGHARCGGHIIVFRAHLYPLLSIGFFGRNARPLIYQNFTAARSIGLPRRTSRAMAR